MADVLQGLSQQYPEVKHALLHMQGLSVTCSTVRLTLVVGADHPRTMIYEQAHTFQLQHAAWM